MSSSISWIGGKARQLLSCSILFLHWKWHRKWPRGPFDGACLFEKLTNFPIMEPSSPRNEITMPHSMTGIILKLLPSICTGNDTWVKKYQKKRRLHRVPAAQSNTRNAAVVRLVDMDSACIEVTYFNASYWQVVARTFDKDLRETRTEGEESLATE